MFSVRNNLGRGLRFPVRKRLGEKEFREEIRFPFRKGYRVEIKVAFQKGL